MKFTFRYHTMEKEEGQAFKRLTTHNVTADEPIGDAVNVTLHDALGTQAVVEINDDAVQVLDASGQLLWFKTFEEMRQENPSEPEPS